MVRQYNCKTCGQVHEPPTGKRCQYGRQLEQEQDSYEREYDSSEEENLQQETEIITLPDMQSATNEQQVEPGERDTLKSLMLEMRLEMKQNWIDFDQRVRGLEVRGVTETTQAGTSDSVPSSAVVVRNSTPTDQGASASPETLRRDNMLMREARMRLADLRQDDFDEDDDRFTYGPRRNGKKSGSTMTGADVVRRSIDWPHFYIKRMSGASGKGVVFKDLRVEEFALGFMCMIESPHSKYDYCSMTRLFRNIMQDTVDFSWDNARNFYERVGLDVEKGVLQWSDEETIRDMRMTYARIVFPARKESKESKETGPRPTPPSAPTGMKCCATYQRKECENTRDHHPYTHACAYCHRTKSLMCRHPEDDCYRKVNDTAKNAKPRE